MYQSNKNLFALVGISLGLLAFALTSCLDQIDLQVPKGTEQAIVIQGSLVLGSPSKALITVTRLFDFTPDGLKRVNVRSVVLSDESGSNVELDKISNGTYYGEFPAGNPLLSVELGKSYKIDVSTFDGRSYESEWEPLLEVPKVKEVNADFIQQEIRIDDSERKLEDFLRFSVDTDLSVAGQDNRSAMKWTVFRTYKITDVPTAFNGESKVCYVTENPDVSSIITFNGSDIRDASLSNFRVLDARVDHKFAEGAYIQVVQESLSPGAYEYWSQVSDILSRDGNMFESPAGKIKSNFNNISDPSDEAFGYFYVTQHDTMRLYVPSELAGNPGNLCPPDLPPPPGGGCPLAICCNCLDEDGSTTVKPSFWEF